MAQGRKKLAEQRQAEIIARLAQVQRRGEEAVEERRREWEALEGRMMTAEEKRENFDDALFLKMNVMTNAYIKILNELSNEIRTDRAEQREWYAGLQAEIAEQRAQLRANTEAVLRMIDRLPPREGGARSA